MKVNKPKVPPGYRLTDDPNYTICPGDMLWNAQREEWFPASVPIDKLLSATEYNFVASLGAPDGYVLCYANNHVIDADDMWWDGMTCVWHKFATSAFKQHIGCDLFEYWRVIAVSREWLKEQQKESEAKMVQKETNDIDTTTSGGLASIVPDIKEGLKLSAGKAADESGDVISQQS